MHPLSSAQASPDNGGSSGAAAAPRAEAAGTQASGGVTTSQPQAEEEKKGLRSGTRELPPEITVGKKRRKIVVFNDEHWSRLRRKNNVPDDFLHSFDFDEDLKDGGGKGGSMLGLTSDKKYIVKELDGGDHSSLMTITPQLAVRMEADDTLLAAFVMHFRLGSKIFIVMTNCMPDFIQGLCITALFDLKGNKDDKAMRLDGEKIPAVHKRVFSCHKCWYFCDNQSCPCYPDDRRLYYNGKVYAFSRNFHMAKDQAVRIRSMLTKDAEALCDMGTMDYSLLIGYVAADEVAVDEGKAGKEVEAAIRSSKFVCRYNGTVYAYFVGVIDFLQDWTCKKGIARCIKTFAPRPLSTVPPPTYADQFVRNLTKRMLGDAKEYRGRETRREDVGDAGAVAVAVTEEVAMDDVEIKIETTAVTEQPEPESSKFRDSLSTMERKAVAEAEAAEAEAQAAAREAEAALAGVESAERALKEAKGAQSNSGDAKTARRDGVGAGDDSRGRSGTEVFDDDKNAASAESAPAQASTSSGDASAAQSESGATKPRIDRQTTADFIAEAKRASVAAEAEAKAAEAGAKKAEDALKVDAKLGILQDVLGDAGAAGNK